MMINLIYVPIKKEGVENSRLYRKKIMLTIVRTVLTQCGTMVYCKEKATIPLLIVALKTVLVRRFTWNTKIATIAITVIFG